MKSFHNLDSFTIESWLSYSYVDGEFELEGSEKAELPFSAKSQYKGGVTTSWSDFVATTSARYITKATATEIGSLRGFKTDEYGIADLFLSYRGLKDSEISLWVKNVADRDHYQPNVGNTAFSAVPQDGRTIYGQFRYHF